LNRGLKVNLKELTAENHRSAERKKFAKTLMSGSIDPALYYKYLTNQFYSYVMLEHRLPLFELGIEDIRRANLIRDDLQELETLHGFTFEGALITRSTQEYITYCEDAYKKTSAGLIPHMYVRHFGDMYGGSMIAKRIPGSGKMYEFKDKELLKAKVRAILDDSMADEANKCFEFAIRLFSELEGDGDSE
jgi:heme oxygenase